MNFLCSSLECFFCLNCFRTYLSTDFIAFLLRFFFTVRITYFEIYFHCFLEYHTLEAKNEDFHFYPLLFKYISSLFKWRLIYKVTTIKLKFWPMRNCNFSIVYKNLESVYFQMSYEVVQTLSSSLCVFQIDRGIFLLDAFII